MRPIKFRAWDKVNKKMITHGKPYLLIDIDERKVIINYANKEKK